MLCIDLQVFSFYLVVGTRPKPVAQSERKSLIAAEILISFKTDSNYYCVGSKTFSLTKLFVSVESVS